MRMQLNENSKIVVLFDNSFLDFLYNRKIDLRVLDYISRTITGFDLLIMSEEVYKKAQEKKYEFPYSQIREDLYKNWINLIEMLYKEHDEFQQDYEKNKTLIERAYACFQTHLAKEETDTFISALLFKSKEFNPIIVSDDIRFLYYSGIISSYFGFCLRIFSTFELLTFLDRFVLQCELSEFNEYFNVQMDLETLSDVDNIRKCKDFLRDISSGMKKGIFSTHPVVKSDKIFNAIRP
jgi:hypothetical protein